MTKQTYQSEVIVTTRRECCFPLQVWDMVYFPELSIVALFFKDYKPDKTRIAVFDGVKVIDASEFNHYLDRKSREQNKNKDDKGQDGSLSSNETDEEK